MVDKILPRPTNISSPYWEGCQQGVLRLQCCNSCGAYQFYPRLFCSGCQSQDLAWRDVSGRGQIASFTVVRRGVSEAYPAPYAVALIDLEEGPRMMSHIIEAETDTLAVGDRVEVAFQSWSEDMQLPVFRPSPT